MVAVNFSTLRSDLKFYCGACSALLYNMIFFPRDLIDPYTVQKGYNIFASVLLGLAVAREAHQDDRHAGEEAHECPPGLC